MNDPVPVRGQVGRDSVPDPNIVWLPGATFLMGSDRHYPEEDLAQRVTVGAVWIDRTPVTSRQFWAFVEATGYVTVAEVGPDPRDYPGALLHMLKPGSPLFTPPPTTCGDCARRLR